MPKKAGEYRIILACFLFALFVVYSFSVYQGWNDTPYFLRYDTIRYCSKNLRYDTIRYTFLRYDTIRYYDTYRRISYDTIRYDTIFSLRYVTIRYFYSIVSYRIVINDILPVSYRIVSYRDDTIFYSIFPTILLRYDTVS